jgi:hypothetical protein
LKEGKMKESDAKDGRRRKDGYGIEKIQRRLFY